VTLEVGTKDMMVEFQIKVSKNEVFRNQVIFELLMHGSFEGSTLKREYCHIPEI